MLQFTFYSILLFMSHVSNIDKRFTNYYLFLGINYIEKS